MDPTDDFLEEVRRTASLAAEERAADLAAGRARIGGWWSQPNYPRSYLKAASILVREARATGAFDELAVACAYLQRHALELAIKSLLDMFYTIADDCDELGRVTGKAATTTAPSKKARERLTGCHDLEKLLRDLHAAHQREVEAGATYSGFPADLSALVVECSALERGAPERLRYPSP